MTIIVVTYCGTIETITIVNADEAALATAKLRAAIVEAEDPESWKITVREADHLMDAIDYIRFG